MCRQRRSLLCVSGAYKAASVCDRTERQGTVAQTQRRCFLSFLIPLSVVFLSSLCCLCTENPAAPQCGDATSFSSHYVLIRGLYRRGGGGGGIGPETDTEMHHSNCTLCERGNKTFPETEKESECSQFFQRKRLNAPCISSFG